MDLDILNFSIFQLCSYSHFNYSFQINFDSFAKLLYECEMVRPKTIKKIHTYLTTNLDGNISKSYKIISQDDENDTNFTIKTAESLITIYKENATFSKNFFFSIIQQYKELWKLFAVESEKHYYDSIDLMDNITHGAQDTQNLDGSNVLVNHVALNAQKRNISAFEQFRIFIDKKTEDMQKKKEEHKNIPVLLFRMSTQLEYEEEFDFCKTIVTKSDDNKQRIKLERNEHTMIYKFFKQIETEIEILVEGKPKKVVFSLDPSCMFFPYSEKQKYMKKCDISDSKKKMSDLMLNYDIFKLIMENEIKFYRQNYLIY